MKKFKDLLSGFTPSKIVSESAGAVVSNIMGGLDELITSKEEKAEIQAKIQAEVNRHTEAIQSYDLEETKAYLADNANARDSNAKIQESEHASWLAKNTTYMLAIFVTVGFFGLLFYMMKFHVPAENKDMLNIMLGALGASWVGVTSFFFGSSMSSQKNGETLRNIVKTK
jgi:hypothetical protein